MKIGIIVHSQTNHTFCVAEHLKEKLSEAGHFVILEKIVPDDEKQTDASKIRFKSIPDISKYDALIFGCPVHGFSPSPALLSYLTQLQHLDHKKTACFVTEFFPFPWMGGNRAIKIIKDICLSKESDICGTGVINWSNRHRRKMISDLAEEFSSIF